MENISGEESDERNISKIRYKPLLESGNMNPKMWQNNNQLPWIPLSSMLAFLASRFSSRPALSKLWPSINPPFRFGQALRSRRSNYDQAIMLPCKIAKTSYAVLGNCNILVSIWSWCGYARLRSSWVQFVERGGTAIKDSWGYISVWI
jgi:hypothetical protein